MEITIKKARSEMKNVNLRTENNGDEKVLAVDLKIVANIAAKDAAPLFADAPDMLDSLFDEGGNVLAPTLYEKVQQNSTGGGDIGRYVKWCE